jgi:hypothetical protein
MAKKSLEEPHGEPTADERIKYLSSLDSNDASLGGPKRQRGPIQGGKHLAWVFHPREVFSTFVHKTVSGCTIAAQRPRDGAAGAHCLERINIKGGSDVREI